MTIKRKFTYLALPLAGALLLAACGDSSSDTPADPDKPFAGQTLRVLNYSDFGSDRDDAIKGFEELTGAKVEHTYHAGAEEIRSILRTGGTGNIDVVQPNTTFVMQLADEGLIQPVDTSQIPNLEKVAPAFMEADGIYDGDDLYGVPVLWGTTGMIYNPEVIDEAPTSWAELWDPKYKKRVAFRDNAENAVTFAALYLGQDPYEPEDLDAIEQALRDLQPNITTYWNSVDDFTRGYTAGAIDIGNYWDSTGVIEADGFPIEYVVPEEGIIGWLDTWSIVKDAPNPELAQAWINWMISTEFQAEWANDPTGDAAASANVEVVDEMTEEALARIITYNVDPESVYLSRPISPETQLEYQDMWERVKASN